MHLQHYASGSQSPATSIPAPVLTQLLKPQEPRELGRMASPCLGDGPSFTHGKALVPPHEIIAAV